VLVALIMLIFVDEIYALVNASDNTLLVVILVFLMFGASKFAIVDVDILAFPVVELKVRSCPIVK